jgi:hypothetical protein
VVRAQHTGGRMSRSNHPPPVCASVLLAGAFPVTQRQKFPERELQRRVRETPGRQILARPHLQAQRLCVGEPWFNERALILESRCTSSPLDATLVLNQFTKQRSSSAVRAGGV